MARDEGPRRAPLADVDLQPDVERLHRAIRREPHDPTEGRERVPWFFVATIVVALFWGGWYLGRHGGDFDTTAHIAFAARQAGIAAASAEQTAVAVSDPVSAGRTVYENNCQSCHQASGDGVPGVFPPMIGSEWVTGEPSRLVRILLHGMQGPVEVAGATYNGAMPAWGGVLRDEEIAAVATYVRQLGTNEAGVVTTALVRAVEETEANRSTPWTAAELQRAPPVSAPGGDASGARPAAADTSAPGGGG